MEWEEIGRPVEYPFHAKQRVIDVPLAWVAAGFCAGCVCTCTVQAVLRQAWQTKAPRPATSRKPQVDRVALYHPEPPKEGEQQQQQQRQQVSQSSSVCVTASSVHHRAASQSECADSETTPAAVAQLATQEEHSDVASPLQPVLVQRACQAAVAGAEYHGTRQAASKALVLVDVVNAPSQNWTAEDHHFVMNCKRRLSVLSLKDERPELSGALRFLDNLYSDMHTVLKLRMSAASTSIRAAKESRAVAADAARRTQVRPAAARASLQRIRHNSP
jgi:hypothetical protein